VCDARAHAGVRIISGIDANNLGRAALIIVTGAAGFVGRYLVDSLAKAGEQVIAAVQNRTADKFFEDLGVLKVILDVSNSDTLKKLPTKPAKAFVHLAAAIPASVPHIRSDIFLRTNTLGTFYALEYCRQNNVKKFVHATTLFDCIEHTELPITEAMGRKYASTGDHASYVISKIAASEFVEHYTQEYGLQGINLRFTGLLGYGRQEGFYENGKFYPSAFEVFYRNAKAGKPLEIWGKHEARRDSLYVKDAVRAIQAAISSDSARGLYSIATGKGRTNEDDAKTFAEVFGSILNPVRLVYRPEIPEKNKTYYFDISKAKRDLGWQPAYTYAEIVRDYDREVKAGRFKW
jgi:UDP-glucose 4-epimerase